MHSPREQKPNPHFDHNRVIWSDEYSGQYQPVEYSEQFDEQWRLFLENRLGFHQHTGVETSDPYIDDRIFELTGIRDHLTRSRYGMLYPFIKRFRLWRERDERRDIGGKLFLEPKFPLDYFRGKRCLDIGCGAGRWTRTLLTLGAKVKSVDVSPHALISTRRFNEDVEELNLFDILERRQDLHETFDFVLSWGVVMCTHDPGSAFANVARTVKPGGQLYVMVYAPTYHNSPFVLESRKHYHTELTSPEEKLRYAYEIADLPENAINLLDMLNTFYNWTVSEETIYRWYSLNGFKDVVTLNKIEANKCAYHVLGRKR
jgi:2-polyprenyl-3-methyl-5-hydroxy-6-metoxy-1,4-benzoquinol methylase